jgi:hypothetical protein
MAKKPKEIQIVKVKNPKVGKMYEFLWAKMEKYQGTLIGESEGLTKSYGVKWYSFAVPASSKDAARMGRPYWIYSCSIFDIIKEIPEITNPKNV